MLQYHLDQNPISCPAKCHYYRRPGSAKFKRGLKKTGSSFAVPFAWFAKAAWQTQVAIVVGFVLIVVLSLFPGVDGVSYRPRECVSRKVTPRRAHCRGIPHSLDFITT